MQEKPCYYDDDDDEYYYSPPQEFSSCTLEHKYVFENIARNIWKHLRQERGNGMDYGSYLISASYFYNFFSASDVQDTTCWALPVHCFYKQLNGKLKCVSENIFPWRWAFKNAEVPSWTTARGLTTAPSKWARGSGCRQNREKFNIFHLQCQNGVCFH